MEIPKDLKPDDYAKLLELAYIGAGMLGGAEPDEKWGLHTEPESECRTCQAWDMFDRIAEGEYGNLPEELNLAYEEIDDESAGDA